MDHNDENPPAGWLTQLVRCARRASPDRSSAVFLCLVLFAVSLTFTISRCLTSSVPEHYPDYVGPLVIVGLEVAGIFCLLLMSCFVRVQPGDHDDEEAGLQQWHRFLRDYIKLFGIVPFFFVIVLFDFFRFLAHAACVDAWSNCANREVRIEKFIGLAHSPVRILYFFFMMVACVQFNKVKFLQNTVVLAGLAVVEAINFSVWLNALVEHSCERNDMRYLNETLSLCFNETYDVVDQHFVQCFNSTTSEYQLYTSASPYLHPFIMEYLMLVIECVAVWFFSNARRDPDRPEVEPAAADPDGPPPPQPPQEDDQLVGDQGDDDDEALLGEGSDPAGADVNRAPRPWFFLFVAVSSITSLLVVFFAIVSFFVVDNDFYLNMLMGYRSGYWLALSLAALVGYVASGGFDSGPMKPNGFEYFVIFSGSGPILYSIFSMIANMETDEIPTSLFLTEEIMNILQIGIQVAFYAHAKSVRIRNDGDERKRLILLGVLAYFAVCNFAVWVEDSFIETRTSATSWQKQYFNKD